jgi:hypothetical protein
LLTLTQLTNCVALSYVTEINASIIFWVYMQQVSQVKPNDKFAKKERESVIMKECSIVHAVSQTE